MDAKKRGVTHEVENAKKPFRSMWRARSEKKAAQFRHATNNQAGHVQIDEYHLHRTGLRGRKRYFIWSGFTILLVIALANLVLNCALIVLLQLTPSGLPYLVFTQSAGNDRVLFPKIVNISASEMSHTLSGYSKRSLRLQSETFDVHAGIRRRYDHSSNSGILNSSQLLIDSDNVVIKPFSQFRLISPGNGEDIMILNRSSGWIGPTMLTNNLHSNTIITKSLNAEHLKVNCSANGATSSVGCSIRITENIVLSSDSVTVSSQNGDVRIALRQGSDLVLQGNNSSSFLLPNIPQYQAGTGGTGARLCICENGRVYRTLGSSCLINTSIFNPCRSI